MKTKTTSLFIMSLIALLVVLGVIGFAFYKIKLRTNSVKEYYATEMQKNNVESFNKLKSEKNILDEYERIFLKTFLQEEEIVSFMKQIESVATKYGLDITIDKVEKGAQDQVGSYIVQPISFYLTIKGNYLLIQKFIQENLKEQKILRLKEIKLYNTDVGIGTYESKIILLGNSISL